MKTFSNSNDADAKAVKKKAAHAEAQRKYAQGRKEAAKNRKAGTLNSKVKAGTLQKNKGTAMAIDPLKEEAVVYCNTILNGLITALVLGAGKMPEIDSLTGDKSVDIVFGKAELHCIYPKDVQYTAYVGKVLADLMRTRPNKQKKIIVFIDRLIKGRRKPEDKEKPITYDERDAERERLTDALLFFNSVTIKGTDCLKGRKREINILHIFDGAKIRDDYAECPISSSLLEYLEERKYYGKINPDIFMISGYNTNSFSLAYGLNHIQNMRNTLGLEDHISIPAALEYTNLPTREKVRETDRAFRRRIIDPFENALLEAQEAGYIAYFSFNHTNNDGTPGTPITDDEYYALKIDAFLGLTLVFKLTGKHVETRKKKGRQPAVPEGQMNIQGITDAGTATPEGDEEDDFGDVPDDGTD